MESATLLAVDAGVATITLNRPDNKNALSQELVASLASNIEAALTDEAVRVLVLTNVGNTFCAGADLKAAKPGQNAATDNDDGSKPKSFVDIFEMIISSPKPVVGKIAGHITGGGVGLAAVCDISVMDADSMCGFTEVRIGVAPAIISVVCLPKMRQADALELFLTGDRISGQRAAEVGIVNHAVAQSELDEQVDDLVRRVARGGPAALAASKQLVATVPGMSRADAFAWTAELSGSLFRGEEAIEGIAAFRERRDASWIPPDA